MPRKKAATFRCERCGKKFTMAMHLGRHMTTIHGKALKSAKAAKAKKAAKPKKATKVGARKGWRVGRPPGVIGRLGLRDMSLDQLVEVIRAAKEQAGLRIAELEAQLR